MRTRIISGAVAVVIAIVVLTLHNTVALNVAVALLIGGILYELFKATECLQFKSTAIICIVYGLMTPFSGYISKWFLLIALVLVMVAFVTYLRLYASFKFDKLMIMFGTTVLVTLSMTSLLRIHKMSEKNGLFLLIITLCGAWLADTGAYFTGTFFGKHKLCPNISPKKTVEGVIGGSLTNGVILIVAGLVYDMLLGMPTPKYALLFVYGVVCSIVGLLGDLTASLIKRQYGIKDYGNIMPGHGGVMDRFDSVLFVAPFMLVMMLYFPIF